MTEDKKIVDAQGVDVSKKKVKIQALRPFSFNNGKEILAINPGTVVEVSETDAKQFCDVGFKGSYEGHGEGSYNQAMIFRAKRVS